MTGPVDMTNAIEKLLWQYELLREKSNAAVRATAAALDDLNLEKCAVKIREFEAQGGVVGVTRVRAERLGWSGLADMPRGPFFVVGAFVRYDLVRFKLASIKKDGTASAVHPGVEPMKVFILPGDQV